MKLSKAFAKIVQWKNHFWKKFKNYILYIASIIIFNLNLIQNLKLLKKSFSGPVKYNFDILKRLNINNVYFHNK